MSRVSGNDFYLTLLDVRNTPQEGFHSSPAQRMMNRRTRMTLPVSTSLLKACVPENTMQSIWRNQAKQRHYYNRGVKSLEQLRQGDRVKLQPFTPGQREWVDGQVVKEIRPRFYEVQTGGKVYIRNRRHLRKYEPKEDVEPAAEPPVPQISIQASPALETMEQAPQTTDGQEAVSPEGKSAFTRNLTSPWRQRIPNP